MAQKTFEGTSDKENLSEALAAAIAAARDGMAGSLFLWEIESIKGERGGVVGATKITVAIKATTPPQIICIKQIATKAWLVTSARATPLCFGN